MDSDRFLAIAARHELVVPEWHGALTGFLCAGNAWEEADDDELGLLFEDLDGGVVRELLDEVNAQLDSLTLDFEPLIPDDEQPMPERLEGLSEWCRGFVSGFGLGVGDARLEGERRELVTDLLRIGDLDPDADDTDENELEFVELFEFVRVAVLSLHGADVVRDGDDD